MPAGIIAHVENGDAILEFVDRSLKGPALEALLDIGGPGSIKVDTRTGPRRRYIVPVGNAEAADLLDGDEVAPLKTAGVGTGASAALVAADPNAPGNGDDWHTPVEANSSEHAYVGTTKPTGQSGVQFSQFPDSGTGGLNPAPTHADIIKHVRGGGAEEAGQEWPDGEPSLAWSRSELNAYAAHLGVENPAGLANKEAVLDAILAILDGDGEG